MANPQPNDAHGIIAHDIQENLVTRDFSKQQLKIIYLVIRLSWGCGFKGWQYSSYNDFESVGLSKSHVEKNLTFLSNNKVIIWNKQYKIIIFNKNYDIWSIPKVDNLGINKLVHKSLQNGNDVTEMVTMLLKKQEQSYRNGNVVTEKEERKKSGSPSHDDVLDTSKESLLNRKEEEEKMISKICKFYEKNCFGLMGDYEREEMNIYIDQDNIDPGLILEALKTAVDNGARKWGYAKSCLNDWINKNIKTVEQLEAFRKVKNRPFKVIDTVQKKSDSIYKDLSNYEP